MQETKEIILGGEKYTIQEMNLLSRNKILFALTQIAGHGIDGIRGGFYSAIAGSLKRLEPESSSVLMESIIKSGVQFPKFTSGEYEIHFTQHYENQFELVMEILQLNYGKTYDSVKKKLEKIGILTPKYSKQGEPQGSSNT